MNGSKSHVITIRKGENYVPLIPSFIDMLLRHLEKEGTALPGAKSGTFLVPVDLVRLMLPSFVTEEIESIEITFKKRGQ